MELHDLRAHNVTADRVRFTAGWLACLAGVSGGGVSRLLRALAASVAAALDGTATSMVRGVSGIEGFSWVAVVDQEPFGRTPRSNPATYSKAFDIVRRLFARTDVVRGAGSMPLGSASTPRMAAAAGPVLDMAASWST
ncbi:hypothetical protein ACWEJ6_52950 [Nonomuraea sp. NPDC004702]